MSHKPSYSKINKEPQTILSQRTPSPKVWKGQVPEQSTSIVTWVSGDCINNFVIEGRNEPSYNVKDYSEV